MSMIGFAARPGTAVLPMCSMTTASSPSAAASRSRSSSYRAGHRGSYSTTATGSAIPAPRSGSREAREGIRSGVARRITELELDLHQPVVLGHALAPRERTGLDLSGVQRDAEIGDGRVFGLAGAVRDHGREPRAVGELDGFDRLGERADLVELDEHGVRRSLGDPAADPVDVGDEEVVAYELQPVAERLREGLPAVPIVLGEPVLDRHE